MCSDVHAAGTHDWTLFRRLRAAFDLLADVFQGDLFQPLQAPLVEIIANAIHDTGHTGSHLAVDVFAPRMPVALHKSGAHRLGDLPHIHLFCRNSQPVSAFAALPGGDQTTPFEFGHHLAHPRRVGAYILGQHFAGYRGATMV